MTAAYRGLCGVILVFAVFTLSSCGITSWFGKDDDENLKPAELVKFPEKVKIRRLWSASVGNGQGKKYNRLVPALDENILFAAASDGQVAAFETSRGKRLWRRNLKDELSGGVGVGDGLVLVGTTGGMVIALEHDSGREYWRRQLGSEVLAAPAASEGHVVVQTSDGSLYGLSAEDGAEIWRFEGNLPVLTLRGTAAPVIVERYVYAAFANGKVLAFDIRTGDQRWEARVAAPQGQSEIERIVDIDGKPLVVGSALYAASYQGRVGAINLITGRPGWMVEASSYERVAEGLGNLYVSDAGGKVIAHDLATGTVVWQQDQLLRRNLSPPTAFRSWVAVGDFQGYVHILSQLDGRFVGRFKVDSNGVRAEMLAAGDVLYVYGNGGRLAAFRVQPK